jgi:hypothetical protein
MTNDVILDRFFLGVAKGSDQISRRSNPSSTTGQRCFFIEFNVPIQHFADPAPRDHESLIHCRRT